MAGTGFQGGKGRGWGWRGGQGQIWRRLVISWDMKKQAIQVVFTRAVNLCFLKTCLAAVWKGDWMQACSGRREIS